jgi:multidrug resistance efflux pump
MSYNQRLIAGTVGTAILLGLAGFALAPGKPTATASNMTVPRPASSGSADRLVGPGRVEPLSGEIDLSSEFTGTLETVEVREGDTITKGQVLARLRNGNLKARVAEATAQLKLKTAIYEKLKAGNRPEEIDQAKATLDDLTSQVDMLAERAQRQKTLQSGGFATAVLAKEARSAADQATARRAAAAAALEIMRKGARKEEIDAAFADVEIAQAQLDDAEANLDKSELRAPFDGTVLRRYKEPGMRVSDLGSSPILQIGDLSTLIVRTQIDEADIATLRLGARTEIRVPAYPGKQFTGKVVRLSPRLGAKTVTTDLPTEKRDARVLDVIVQLDKGQTLPVGLRVDCFILVE